MIDQLPAIMVLAPMFGALLVVLFGSKNHDVCFPVAIVSLAISLAAAVMCAQQVYTSGPIDYFMGGWEAGRKVEGVEIPLGFGIQLRIDQLNALVLVVIGVILLLVAIYAIRPKGEADTEKTHYFYGLFLLLSTGLFGQTITGDAFNLFVLIEISSLTSYGLIAMGSSPRGTVASFNYVIMGTIGASFYLLGVGYLYLKTGTLNMQGMHEVLQLTDPQTGVAISQSSSVLVAFILMILGMWIKMAFFPLHGWLPNAYSYCPSSTGAVLAPLMTKISVYVMIRMMVSIFGLEWVFGHLGWNNLVVGLAVIAIFAGSAFALAQKEIKKMLCYLIVAEVGYMVGGAWLADKNGWGITGATYHILADAMMTVTLFLAVGILAKRANVIKLDDLEGLFKKMPLTMVGFVVAALAMIGVPPTCGFFSKFYLIRGGIESGQWIYVAALLISSLINAVLFFRIFEIAHFGRKPPEGHHHHEEESEPKAKGLEASLTALIPLWIGAALIILLGLFNGQIVEFIRETPGLIPNLTTSVDQ